MTTGADLRRTVADVVAIIGHDQARVDKIEEAVRGARRKSDIGWPPHPLTKADKHTARSIASALKRAEKTLGYSTVAPVIYRATQNAQDDFSEWTAELRRWRRCFEAFGGILRIEGPTFFPRDAKQWPLDHKKKSTDELVRKRRAVEAAALLLNVHGLPLSVTRISGMRVGSAFCRVAAALYGEKRADLSYQCRAYKARNRGPK